MLLAAHIFIAMASIAFTIFMLFAPSRTKLRASYASVGLTLASGVLLVAVEPARLTHACITGLVYLAIVLVGIELARHRLAATTS